MTTDAGKGEHHVYKIVPQDSSDRGKLTAGNHYVGVEAVAWYINKQSSWFSDRMASGTLGIKMSGGLENYQVALGTFNLSGGARIAPVFEKPVLGDRNYRGGPIIFSAMLSAVKKDTVIGGMLKSAASASLGIVAGMVETAALTGPAGILAAAGQDIISSVRGVLGDKSLKGEALFDFTGMEFGLRPEVVVGPQIFLLFHRGADLEEARLSVRPRGQLLMPYYDEAILDDGAWLMLRIRRNDEYSGVREWFTDARKLRTRARDLVDDYFAHSISREDALAQLKPSGTGDKTVQDEFFRLRSIISNDGVISERQAGLFVAELNTKLMAAREAIEQNNRQIFITTVEEVTDALSRGQRIEGKIGETFMRQVKSIANVRSPSLVKANTDPHRITKLAGDELFRSMQYMPRTLKISKQLGRKR